MNKQLNYKPLKDVRIKTHPHNEQGATLVIVLMMVLLLALIGALAVRNSQVSSDMTTSSQVNQLLLQSSDAPIAKLDMSTVDTVGTTTETQLQQMGLQNNGPFGTLRVEGNKNDEYVLCYQPLVRDSLYAEGQHRIVLSADGKTVRGNSAGYCNLTDTNSYTSQRGTVSSQVSITRPTVNDNVVDDIEIKPLAAAALGTDSNSAKKNDSTYFRAYVTSVLPALSITATTEDIDKCLQLPIGGLAGTDSSTNQIVCLDETDTPINIQVQDYVYVSESN